MGYSEAMENLSKLREIVKDRGAWHAAVHVVGQESDTTLQLNNNGHEKSTTTHNAQYSYTRQ